MKIKDPILREAYNEMHREYQHNRYHTNSKYRKKKLESNRRWRETHPEQWKRIHNESNRKRYLKLKEGLHGME